MASYLQGFLFFIFFLSGFSGLIYESVWSGYLKLFLGHAAYAQTLVLSLYMGGMAVGAWLAGRHMQRLTNPLMAYAAAELLIGLFGMVFHPVFVSASDTMLDQILPGIESPFLIELIRWGGAALLIVPQTLLLGATFPLISVGILRSFPLGPGRSISVLYFTNSMGAVIGVLLSGFVLVAEVGLPGTIMAAALVNILLALMVYFVAKHLAASQAAAPATVRPPLPLRTLQTPLLIVALVTGLSSFVYEVTWIRMLSMVLGASTHAFEFMLSAFILGLALGGLWLRKRIDAFPNPLRALGIIQLLMGLLALASVLAYNSTFQLMGTILPAIARNDVGYVLFNLSSHLIALMLMLPVTFMAGMTLPLITAVLFKHGNDESAIGKVYAFNTLGAILGVAITALILLPLLGLKLAMVTGAALDLGLAVVLLSRAGVPRQWQLASGALVLASLTGVMLAAPFNTLWMSSTVFRNGSLLSDQYNKVVLHRDGRTATVDVTLRNNGLYLTTNGKTDASATIDPNSPPTQDENTMTMLGGLPLLAKPDAKTAAVIGMGAGMSANVLLSSKQLTHLDVVEIEGAMIDGARMFGKVSERVFTDPRSQIHIDDAKSYFAAHKKRYDLIISEPSDSWVSGVSSLFTDEFYHRIGGHLTEDGLLVQWLHIYEMSPELVASVFLALGNNFEDYRIYASNFGNLIILAKAKGKVAPLDANGFANPTLAAAFERVNFNNMDDVHMHEIGDKALLEPFFRDTRAPLNSDFFPFLDQHAVKSRFKNTVFNDLSQLHTVGLPMPGVHFDGKLALSQKRIEFLFSPRSNIQLGRQMGEFFAHGASANIPALTPGLQEIAVVLQSKPACHDAVAQNVWNARLTTLASLTVPGMSQAEIKPMLDFLNRQLCDSPEAEPNRRFLQLMAALSSRNMAAIEAAAGNVVAKASDKSQAQIQYANNALLLSYFGQGKWDAASQLLDGMGEQPLFFAKLIRAHVRMQKAAANAKDNAASR
jgi:predicted membrane-bound spermidine synthase